MVRAFTNTKPICMGRHHRFSSTDQEPLHSVTVRTVPISPLSTPVHLKKIYCHNHPSKARFESRPVVTVNVYQVRLVGGTQPIKRNFFITLPRRGEIYLWSTLLDPERSDLFRIQGTPQKDFLKVTNVPPKTSSVELYERAMHLTMYARRSSRSHSHCFSGPSTVKTPSMLLPITLKLRQKICNEDLINVARQTCENLALEDTDIAYGCMILSKYDVGCILFFQEKGDFRVLPLLLVLLSRNDLLGPC